MASAEKAWEDVGLARAIIIRVGSQRWHTYPRNKRIPVQEKPCG